MAICGLLLNFFAHWPDLFHTNKIKQILSPIVLAKKGKITKRFYTLKDYHQEQNNLDEFEITYIKGLGSMQKSEYKKMIDEPIYVNFIFDDAAKDNLEIVFGDDASKRKEWLTA